MANPRLIAVIVSFMTLGVSSTALAQRWGFESTPRDGVCFYKDPNFRGEYFCARSGEDLRSLPEGMNDRISSVRLFGRVEVTVYRDIRFKGESTRFDSDVRNLKDEGWNDLISSVEVRSRPFGGFGRPSGNNRGPRRTEDPDRIVRRAYEDVLHREPDEVGLRTYRSKIIDDNWSEQEVREALRNSREFRENNTMTLEKAQEIVRRAYLSVLKREPDAGSQGWVNKVLRERWTQQDVERELRNSPEYRRK